MRETRDFRQIPVRDTGELPQTKGADLIYENQTFRVYLREISPPPSSPPKFHFWVEAPTGRGGSRRVCQGYLSAEGRILDLWEIYPGDTQGLDSRDLAEKALKETAIFGYSLEDEK